MTNFKTTIFLLIISSLFLFSSCSDEKSENTKETTTKTVQTSSSEKTTTTTSAITSASSSATTQAPETTTAGPSLQKVILSNGSSDVGNYNSAFAHLDFNVSYNGEYVSFINWDTMYFHGDDIYMQPEKVDGFVQRSLEPKYYNGNLYYIVDEDGTNSIYYLYSWDFNNDPVKVTEQPVYTFIILNNQVFFTEEFVQGPLYALDLSTKQTKIVSEYSAMSFISDGKDLYFKSSNVGTAPGIVKIDMDTSEESIVLFPFYSNNFIVFDGYVYYEGSTGNLINISKQKFLEETPTVIVELEDYAVSLNISEGRLYYQTENFINSCDLDGNDIAVIHEGNGELKRGTYIIGDRIYFRDYDKYYMVKKDGSDLVELYFD